MPWLRRSVTSLSMRRPWFNPRPVHVRCGTHSSTGPGFSLSTWVLLTVALYQHTILIHPFLHLVLALYRMYQEEFAISGENMLLRLVYINIASHAQIQSSTVTQIITWRKHSLLAAPCTITVLYDLTCTPCMSIYEPIAKPRQAKPHIDQFMSW